ncbi:MAG: NADH-quinone oxidoreductase subunit J [Thiohalocapsa sp.]|jgi:formate hydrogenlyase subunit 3/multisubunit Na+/H+ antiporter MnhD subunit|uniref:complex I subunit 5 family protein n=1 Tax=Thiohalocapsa sp. TaxID=2497641 RepID=UPI0025DDB8BA|nr:proton-conducting transporter membrane subunit [Thiohalocapsa sp.]MCG6942886.1 NADH-quinone oxidoreductase subunit J [Thiohalocapsa sp.]
MTGLFSVTQNHTVLPVVLPLLAAFLMQPLARVSAPVARLLGPATLAVSAYLLIRLWLAFGSTPYSLAIGGYAPPLGIVFYVDRLALLFATAVPVLALLFWSRGEGDADAARRDAVMLLLAAAATGLALSGDLFNIYVFYELTAVASFGLISLRATGAAYIATVRYLLLSAFGSVLALVGIAIVYLDTGTLNLAHLAVLAPENLAGPTGLAAFALLLIGFGIKAELFPLNTWVPEVYATAPARISALLAGLVSKLAVIVVVRLLVLAFDGTGAAQLMLALGALGFITGELAAWRARDLNRMLAYSSIGQLGLVFIGFSLSGTAGVLAGLALALHHLVIKSALFALATRWRGALERLTGAARSAPIAAALVVLFALSLIGVPPLPGFWAKLLVLLGLADLSTPLALGALALVLLGTAVEVNYLFRLVVRLYGRPDDAAAPAPPRPKLLDLGIASVAGVLLLVTTIAVGPVSGWLRGIAEQAADRAVYIETVLPDMLVQARTP